MIKKQEDVLLNVDGHKLRSHEKLKFSDRNASKQQQHSSRHKQLANGDKII